MRPDWTIQTYNSNKIDLSTNICYDKHLPLYNWKFDKYSNAGRCYNILADYHNVQPTNIAIGLGLGELITRVLAVVKKFNYKIDILEKPTWKPVEVFANLYNIQEGDDVLYIANPNGNNGQYHKDIDSIVKKYKIAIVDEAYADFTPYQSVSLADNVIVLKTLSKSIAMPGLRFAWAIGPYDIIKEIQEIRPVHITTCNVEDHLYDILNNIKPHTTRMIETRNYIEENFDCTPSMGNYVLFNNLPKGLEEVIQTKEIQGKHRMALCNLEVFKNAI